MTAVDPPLAERVRPESAPSVGMRRAGAAALIRDVILGGQDGLVNVLGLVLGMAVATGDARVVVTAGLAAMMAESLAMAGVAYTASGAERQLSARIGERLAGEVGGRAAERHAARRLALEREGTPPAVIAEVVAATEDEAAAWRDELDRARMAMAPVRETRPIRAAFVVGLATVTGSAVPLLPFVLLPMTFAPIVALVAAAVVLFIAGVERARLTEGVPLRAGLEMTAIGVLSAFAGYLIGQLLRTPAA
jgi:VIT1/CCC1 family predicted Fe2+/Mn2+ transporter